MTLANTLPLSYSRYLVAHRRGYFLTGGAVKIERSIVRVGDLDFSYLSAGEGPLVVLCHGFPQTALCFQSQIVHLASLGYRAVAPDLRGYGGSSKPYEVSKYSILHLTGDIISLIEALGESKATIVGHDWGANVAWYSALFRPDVIDGVFGMSVTYRPSRPKLSPVSIFSKMGDPSQNRLFYMVYFQQEGLAEAEFDSDPEGTIRKFLYGVGSESPGDPGWNAIYTTNGRLLDQTTIPKLEPDWLNKDYVAQSVRGFKEGGFRPPLNYYRNLDKNWELTEAFNHQKITVPAAFLVGEKDMVRIFSRRSEEELEAGFTDLRFKRVIKWAGHWLQQEKAEEVNANLEQFLTNLHRRR